MMEGQHMAIGYARGLQKLNIQLYCWEALSVPVCFGQCIRHPKMQVPVLFCWPLLVSRFPIMRARASVKEMVVEELVAGSFSHFAQHWGRFMGFEPGWNHGFLVLVAMGRADRGREIRSVLVAGTHPGFWHIFFIAIMLST